AEEIAEGPHSEIIIIKKFDEEGRIQFCTNFVYKGDEPVQYGILTTRKPEFINKSLTLDIEGLTNTLADSVFYRFRMRDLGDGCVARTYMIIGEGENQQVLYGDQVVVYYAEL
ncbi:MAG: hypothetical protein IJ561_04580, partial [Ruminococcus sp.]|nr:hypothetical protein [Ruminococcus sp.]